MRNILKIKLPDFMTNQTTPAARPNTWTAWLMQTLIILCVYSIWVIQPWYSDDWGRQWVEFSIPRAGHMFRIYVASWYASTVSPFSFFQPWALLTAISATALAWNVVAIRQLVMRGSATLVLILGFPYFGHVATNPSTFGVYVVPVAWLAIWLLIYFQTQSTHGVKPWHWPIIFGASFMVAIWSEVFLIAFFGVVAYLFYDAWRGDHNRQSIQRGNSWLVASVVLVGYLLALLYYTSGGHPEAAISSRGGPGNLIRIRNPATIAHALLQGSKEIAVLLKDCLPLFVIAGYIKLKNKAAYLSLEKHYKLFLALTAGIFGFMIICVWLAGVIQWRTRWPCAVVLICTFISIPETLWGPVIGHIGQWRWKSHLALISWWSALIWLAANAYFTYGYTNIDVRGWLQYRQMVVDRNPAALDRLCCRTLPAGRPRGVAWWDHEWGAQDDRYRYFMAPDLITVRGNVRFYWGR